jgi:acyl-CoA synthetase (AMP-forming)/AMP-acid ligase II
MLITKRLLRAKNIKLGRFFCSMDKFPENTVPGVLKDARNKNEWKDCVRFDSQNMNFTLKEFDVYTSAFAYGLLEQGYRPGDKIMLWLDQENSAETATAQIGAMKAGCSIVTVDNKDEIHHIADTLEKTGSKSILLSPHTKLDGKTQRVNMLLDILPELASAYSGEEISFSDFPSLKSVVHTGHASIRGTSKFKENMSYTLMENTTHRMNGISGDSLAFECYNKGEQVASLTQKDIVKKAKDLYKKHFDSGNIDTCFQLLISSYR